MSVYLSLPKGHVSPGAGSYVGVWRICSVHWRSLWGRTFSARQGKLRFSLSTGSETRFFLSIYRQIAAVSLPVCTCGTDNLSAAVIGDAHRRRRPCQVYYPTSAAIRTEKQANLANIFKTPTQLPLDDLSTLPRCPRHYVYLNAYCSEALQPLTISRLTFSLIRLVVAYS